jgi:hypothetical protein
MRRIKLIWDFRGMDAEKTALHHEIHLKEFAEREKIQDAISGIELLGEHYSIAYITVNEDDMLKVRDALIPHRGELA